MSPPLTCSKHGIVLYPSSGTGNSKGYVSFQYCPLCGEKHKLEIDFETGEEKHTIVQEGELRVHYFKVDSDLNIRIAACDDCRRNYFICIKEKKNGIKAAYCPGHDKFIRSWDRVSWVKIPAPVTSIELKGVLM